MNGSYVVSETEKTRDEETHAAIQIQKNWRMLRVKWNFERITAACRQVQRCYRGFKGEESFINRKETDRLSRQHKFFSEMAKIIQK